MGSGVAPPLDTDEAALAAAACDFGRLHRHAPRAVARPRNAAEVVGSLELAHASGLPIAVRGSGHGVDGHCLSAGGVVLDIRALDAVAPAAPGAVWVQAGATFRQLLTVTLGDGQMPPVVPDYLDLSVGGVISAGGFGGASFRHGCVVDNLLALEVVTGGGEVLRCGPDDRRELFDACRAGWGRCAVIIAAQLRLVPATASVRARSLRARSAEELLAILDRCAQMRAVEQLEATARVDVSGHWQMLVDVVETVDPDAAPSGGAVIPRLAHADRRAAWRQELGEQHSWELAHPWLDLLVPRPAAGGVISAVQLGFNAAAMGAGGLLALYPLRTELLGAPLLPHPAHPDAVLVDVLRADQHAHSPAALAALRERNADIARAHAERGAVPYPISALDIPASRWRQLLGDERVDAWDDARRRHDPDGLLRDRLAAPA